MTGSDPRREFAVQVVRTLREAGYEALWAGGCVRDLILDLTPEDYDVATSAEPERVARLFRRTVPVGASFGVVRVLGPKGAGEVEVATFRSDGAYVDGRRPQSVVYSTAEQDAQRRDFTINGMFLDPLDNRAIDYVGGMDDLRSRTLRAIGNPLERFREDKLRLIRAVRFAARFDLRIEGTTEAAIRAMADQIRVVSVERIAQELKKMLAHPRRSWAIRQSRELGLLAAILPTLNRTAEDHPDAWEATLRTLDDLPTAPSFPLSLAALLADLSPDETESICHGLRLSNTETDRASWLVAHQRRLTSAATLPRSRLKSLLHHQGIEELFALIEARARATGDAEALADVAWCRAYARELPDGPLAPDPFLTGRDLIEYGLKPGPRFAEILQAAYDAQLEGRITSKDEALEWLRRWLEREN